jgi:mannose-6-phosphate isomerase-like protein (cupin superfamily)
MIFSADLVWQRVATLSIETQSLRRSEVFERNFAVSASPYSDPYPFRGAEMPQHTTANEYGVKDVKTIAKGSDVLARIFTLAPDEEIEWHFHSECHDSFFVLQGDVTIEVRDPDNVVLLHVGMSHDVPPRQQHFVLNRSSVEARFLLIQGVGRYDFVKVNS